jgi:hypothetical protein
MTVPDRDVPQKRVDPTRNQSAAFQLGVACVQVNVEAPRSYSRLTESSMGEVFGMGSREATPERRRTPGQVVRGGLRPKDSLAGGGCVATDKQDHPLALPRKAGSAQPGVGTGGSGHLEIGPLGFVPQGPGPADDTFYRMETAERGPAREAVQFRPVWGT